MTIPVQLLAMLNHTDEPWAIKSNTEIPIYLYVNAAYKKLHNLPHYDFIGKTYLEIPHEIANYASSFIQQDRLVATTHRTISSLTTTHLGDTSTLQTVLGEQHPFYDAQGKIIALLFNIRFINLLTHYRFFKKKFDGYSTFKKPTKIFTEKEWQVIFLLFCNFTQRQISITLSITLAAVEYRVRCCLRKTNTKNCQQLLKLCHINQWDTYVPSHFLTKGHIILDS